MYKHILIPIDGSETSLQALKHAIELGSDQRAQLILLNVIEDYNQQVGELYLDQEVIENEFKAESLRILEESGSIVKQAGLECMLISYPMSPAGEDVSKIIVQAAKKNAADLIVIGSHGRSGVQRLLLGSVAEGVMRLSDIPIMLIHGFRKDEEK